MVKILAALSILNSSGASPGATEKVAALVARATCSGASHSSTNEPTIEKRCTLLDGRFIRVNLSKLTHYNQIFRNDSVRNQYHLCKLSVQNIECNFYDLLG